MEKNFTHCPHCAVRGRDRIIQPATRRTPHLSRSDGMTFHLFLEELNVRPRDGHDPHSRELIALFRYDLEPAQKAESAMIQLGPAADTEEKIRQQLEHVADRLAAILETGDPLRRLYAWHSE